MISYSNKLVLGLALGGTFLWLWKSSELKKEKRRQRLRYLANNCPLTLDSVEMLTPEDLTDLLDIVSNDKTFDINTRITEYMNNLNKDDTPIN